VAGVASGFIVGEKILAKKGFRRARRRVKVSLFQLPEYLQKKYLVHCAVVTENGKKIVRGFDNGEIESLKVKLKSLGGNEILLIENSNYTYAIEKGETFILVRGRFISMRDFSEVWALIQSSLER
jgi:hypothetical protein